MSRVGRKPIEIPEGVTISKDGSTVIVKGPMGELSRELSEEMVLNINDNVIEVERPSESKEHRSLHGTTRSLVSNMVDGVKEGFTKTLELVGVGYRANKTGNKLVLNVGYSHPVEFEPDEGIEFDVPSNTQIIVKGIDKELVGATAAKIRAVREPEPYKGKGIKYQNERIIRKEGKTGK